MYAICFTRETETYFSFIIFRYYDWKTPIWVTEVLMHKEEVQGVQLLDSLHIGIIPCPVIPFWKLHI